MRIRTLALCLAFSTATAFAQHDSAAWYHPLHVGNEWIYKTTYSQTNFPNPPVSSVDFLHRIIERDTVIDNAVWAIIRYDYIKAGESGSTRERYDTLSSRFFIGSDFIDSVRCILPSVQFGSPMPVTVQSVYADTIVSIPTVSRHLKMWVTGAQREWIFSYGLGMTSMISGDGDIFFGSGSQSSLAYAKINGVEYGTEPLTVNDESNVIPKYFALHQNYPNPFNPSTTITFNIPSNMDISLKVYTVIGMETTSIAGGKYPAGIHSVQWRPDGLASGVYFYTLRAGKFSQTKKLILLK